MSILVEQAVAAATQYTGVAGAGLVDWSAATGSRIAISPTNFDETVVINTLALETEELIPEIFIRFVLPGENIVTTLRRVTILRPAQANSVAAQATRGFSYVGCGIYVPRLTTASGAIAAGTLWNLVLTTTGKTQNANFIVEFETGVKPGKMPNR